jgi:hypothetical protein
MRGNLGRFVGVGEVRRSRSKMIKSLKRLRRRMWWMILLTRSLRRLRR